MGRLPVPGGDLDVCELNRLLATDAVLRELAGTTFWLESVHSAPGDGVV